MLTICGAPWINAHVPNQESWAQKTKSEADNAIIIIIIIITYIFCIIRVGTTQEDLTRTAILSTGLVTKR